MDNRKTGQERDNVGMEAAGERIAAEILEAIRSRRDLWVFDQFIGGSYPVERVSKLLIERRDACFTDMKPTLIAACGEPDRSRCLCSWPSRNSFAMITIPIEVGLQQNHNRSPHHAGHANRLNLAACQNLGRVTWVPRLHSERGKRVRIPQRVGGGSVYRSHLVQQLRDIMRLRKLDLALNQESLQVLLNCLLAMKRNDFPETAALCRKLLRRLEIRRGFVEPLPHQLAECAFRRLHRGHARTSGRDRRSLL